MGPPKEEPRRRERRERRGNMVRCMVLSTVGNVILAIGEILRSKGVLGVIIMMR